jgi:hypothetical protein
VSQPQLQIRELAAWGFDPRTDHASIAYEELQDRARKARRRLELRETYRVESPISIVESQSLAGELAHRVEAIAASGEFDGLAWQLAVVDLRKLIAFQRQIRFADDGCFQIEPKTTWQHLLDLALPVARPQPRYTFSSAPDGRSISIRSLCPSLTIQFADQIKSSLDSVQLVARTGSPYFEVASYRGRWFLRDGYHRSFLLLKQGICHVPAVVVRAETLTELGAVGQKFFTEEVLFSHRPPMVTDFLDEEMVACFLGPCQEKVTQISIQELWEPVQAGYPEREVL